MSTPDQPNDENRSLGGPARNGTESVPGPRPNSAQGAHPESAPSGRPERPAQRPLQPRPISRSETAKQPSAEQQGGDQPPTQAMAKPDGREEQAPRQPLPKRPTGGGQNGRPRPVQTPPWQREPQSNLYRPGQSPVQGRPPSDRSGSGTLSAAASAAAAATNDVERAARKQVNRSKSAVIDGPTRSLARPEQPKDMPDLSDTRHPVPSEETGSRPKKSPAVVATPEPLRATVQIRKIDPWSMLQVSLVISAALFFVWMVAVGLLYVVLDGMGVWDRLNNAFTDIVSDSSSGGLISAGQVFGYAAVIGLINAVLMTALATIGSFIYNQCSDLVGGVQVTLADPD